MNTIFTLRRIAVAAVLCIIASTSVLAGDYKPMIRYDRVWEHISIRWEDRQVYHVKFNGVEEINGKTYHRLNAFRKSDYAYDNDLQPYLFDTDESYYQHEGYLREEDGKVYVLVINTHPEEEIQIYQLLRWSPKSEDLPYVTEKLLYDFTCKEGESYKGMYMGDYECYEMNYHVKSIERIQIDGEEYRLFRVYVDDFEHSTHPIIEGVGIGSYGCLTTINFFDVPTCPCMSYLFNRVLSTNGEVLYRAEDDCVDLPFGDFLDVNHIADKFKAEDATIYDMMGRRISRPAPGQLYIQGGKKKIAPRN